MLIEKGTFNASGSPCLRFRLAGALPQPGKRAGVEYEAVIDTGFAGFVSMPLSEAFPLGLVLSGLVNIELADGSRRDEINALGAATFCKLTRWGPVILSAGSQELLVGMKFLKAFGLTLVMNEDEILLINEPGDWLEEIRGPCKKGYGVREPAPPAYWPTADAFSIDTPDAQRRCRP